MRTKKLSLYKHYKIEHSMKKFILTVFILFAFSNAYTQDKFKEIKTAQDVIDNYIIAIGGADKIGKIMSESMNGTLSVQGMEIGFYVFRNDTLYFKKAEGEAHGKEMLLMKGLTTNSFAWEYQTDGMQDFQGEELLKKQQELITGNLRFVLDYKKYGYSFELKGLDTVNENPCYKIELFKAGNLIRTSYYDAGTFFLTEHLKPDNTSIVMSDYRETGGIYRPFKIIQNSQIEITIDVKDYTFNKMIDESLLSKPTDN